MKIKDWITREIIAIKPESSVKEAFMLLKSMGIRHLPVVKNGVLTGKLDGIITESDILRAFAAGKK